MLDVKGAAEKLNVSINTIYREIEEGKLTAYKIRGAVRIKESDLDSYLEGQLATSQITASQKQAAGKAAQKVIYQPKPLYEGRRTKKKLNEAFKGYTGLKA